MLKKTFTLQNNYPLCGSCRGSYLKLGKERICPYLKSLDYEMCYKRKWERMRNLPETFQNTTQFNLKYQVDIKDVGLATIEAIFKMEFSQTYKSSCTVLVKVTGGPEQQIMDSLVELLKKK